MHATDRARDWRTGRARRHAQMEEEMERKAARKQEAQEQEAQEQEAQEQEAQEQEARGPSPVMRPGLAAG